MNKALLGAAAAVVFGAVAFSASAQAQCMWNGFDWSCAGPPAPAYSYYQPYSAAVPWQTYPTTGYDYNGYKPQWLPSYPGPRPSSGAGR
jgi:hypothetical protein